MINKKINRNREKGKQFANSEWNLIESPNECKGKANSAKI